MEVQPQLVKDPPDIRLFDFDGVVRLPTVVQKRARQMPQLTFAGDAVSLPGARGCVLKIFVEFVKFIPEKLRFLR
jgi:hypothetical protein